MRGAAVGDSAGGAAVAERGAGVDAGAVSTPASGGGVMAAFEPDSTDVEVVVLATFGCRLCRRTARATMTPTTTAIPRNI